MKKTILTSIAGLLAVISGSVAMAQCPTISCPSNIAVNNDPSTCGAVVSYSAPTTSNPCATETDTFNYSGSIVNWTVPAGVTSVHIEARGAQGGWNTSSTAQPGMGAVMGGDFTVTPGQQLKILVGQQPSNGSGNGGGGGTFVTDMSNNPLIVAGGGGGSSQGADSPDKHGQVGTTGGTGAGGGGIGGMNGNGGSIGASGFQSGAGGGLLTNGADGWTTGTGGSAFVNGGAGGATNAPANGGFGGGGSGSSYVVGGGGGGYSGGGSGGNSTAGVGGGGGSYNGGTNQVNTGGANTGNGMVLISYSNGSSVTLTQTAGPASGSLFPLGATTITYQADDGLGNTVSCSFTVTVTDNTAPVPNASSIDVSSECAVTVTAPTATDNCGTITGTTADPLTYSAEGTYTVNWTYDDGNGNTTTQVQTVTIDDITAPVADAASLSNVTGECSVTVTSVPTATDNCAGAITATTTDPLTYTALGTYTITWTYDDGNGNTSVQTQTVVVEDNTAPVADVDPLPNVTGQCSATVTAMPTASDNCSGASITGITSDPLTYNTPGTYTITWTYDDGNGNISLQSQQVVVSGVNTGITSSGITLTAAATGATYEWMDCANGSVIAGETGQSFTATANGNYAVIVTENGCTDTSSCVSVTSVGIASVDMVNGISVYPNPTSGIMNIQLQNATGADVLVYNVFGQLVLTQKLTGSSVQVDLSAYEAGIYYITVRTAVDSKVIKAIKN